MSDPTDNVEYDSPGVPRRLGKQTSPGVSGAISDAVGAIAQAVAPKSITQRRSAVDSAVSSAAGDDDPTGRMRSAQSSDRDNGYSN